MCRYPLSLLILSAVPSATSFGVREPSSVAGSKPFSEKPASNINFEEWISDAPNEVSDWVALTDVTGKIPNYLMDGTLIRNGGGLWGIPGGEQYSHIFDGLAKISAYRFNTDERGTTVEYLNKFIDSNWYRKVQSTQKIPSSLAVGPVLGKETGKPKTGVLRLVGALMNALQFDNTPVNIWDYDPQRTRGPASASISALTDAPARADLSLETLQTLHTGVAPSTPLSGSVGYELLSTAHPEYSKTSADTYNVVVQLGLSGARVSLTREQPGSNGTRCVVGSSRPIDNGVPYLHSFGLTHRHAIVVLQPLRVNLSDLSATLERGFLRAMLPVEQTRVVVFDLNDGSVVLDESVDEKIYFYHTISTSEWEGENGDTVVSMRLCAYESPDIITGEHQFMRLEQCRASKGMRNRISRGGTVCDVECRLSSEEDNTSVKFKWNKDLEQGFELPTTRYSRVYGPDALQTTQQHPRYVYAFGAYANGSSEYDSWGLFKFDMDQNCVASCYQQASRYVSEPIFVADPDGSSEDDGLILSQVYDGIRQETALLILDARNMRVLAEVWTGHRSPMDFHGAWIPGAVGMM